MVSTQDQIEALCKKIQNYQALHDDLGEIAEQKIAALEEEIALLIQSQQTSTERRTTIGGDAIPTLNLTGALTFLFTDIEGSTQLWEEHPEAMKNALARHDVILRQAIETHHGYVFKTVGDAFYATFTDASNALAAAIEAQQALLRPYDGEPITIRVRMGLHTGTVEARNGDYFGPPLNRVARLMAAGHGGQVLLSTATAGLLRANLPANIDLRDMGERRLKDLNRPEHIYQLIAPNLPADFPPLKTLDAFQTNLPPQLTSFIGREKEIAALKVMLAKNRLTTLTGSGGAGKTRLSLQVAADLLDSFPNGVWFAELAPLADPTLIPQTVASALGLREEGSRSLLDILTNYLRPKKALLILDNCEHLVEAAAQFVETIIHSCPNLCLLVSSREVLGIHGEAVFRVPSLSTPKANIAQPVSELATLESVRLFVERAQTVSDDFAISQENAAAIAQICSRLDGIPLAIELAAARVQMLRVEKIAERLDDRFRLLTGGSRTALPRQQTLRALIDWSHDLLPESERILLRRLSVFAGGWTLEAAGVVCTEKDEESKNALHPFDVLDLLSQLVNKSLVAVDDGVTETRYRLLETVRQYAREKLTEAGEGIMVRNRHLKYFVQFAERAEPELISLHVMEWLKRLDMELDNIHVALEWSVIQDPQTGLQLASALLWFWEDGGYLGDGLNRLTELLQRPQTQIPTLIRARALNAQGYLSEWSHMTNQGRAILKESLILCRNLGDMQALAFNLVSLGHKIFTQEDTKRGRQMVMESLNLYRELGDKAGMARALSYLGGIADNKNYKRARAYMDEGLSICREIGYISWMARMLCWAGNLATQHGDYHTAHTFLNEGLTLQHRLGRSTQIVITLTSLGNLALREHNYPQARAYYEESLALARNVGAVFPWTLVQTGYVALRQGDLRDAKKLFEESQQSFKDSHTTTGIIYTLEGLASMTLLQGQPARAAQIFAWADATRDATEDTRPPSEQVDVDRDLATICTQLEHATFIAAQTAGRAMGMEEAIALALGQST